MPRPEIDCPSLATLEVTWNPRGPFAVEVDEFGAGWECIAAFPEILAAARHASRVLRLCWEYRRDERRVRIMGPDGAIY